jgi:hypothetical protein
MHDSVSSSVGGRVDTQCFFLSELMVLGCGLESEFRV